MPRGVRSAGVRSAMTDLCRYAHAPIGFFLRYIRRRPRAHTAILVAVLCAIACAVGTQYGLKHLVDTLSRGTHDNAVWWAFGGVVALIAADNFLWRVAGLIGSHTF